MHGYVSYSPRCISVNVNRKQYRKSEVPGLTAWVIVGTFLFALYLITDSNIALGFSAGCSFPIVSHTLACVFKSAKIKGYRPLPHHVAVLGWILAGLVSQVFAPEYPNAEIAVEDTWVNKFYRHLTEMIIVTSSLFFITFIREMILMDKSRRKLIAENLHGRTGYVIKCKGNEGRLKLEAGGSIALPQPKRNWKAVSEDSLKLGARVKIVNVHEKLKYVTVAMISDSVSATTDEAIDAPVSKLKTWHWATFGTLLLALSLLGHVAELEILRYIFVPGLCAVLCSVLPRVPTENGMGISMQYQILLWIFFTACFSFIIYI